MVSINQQAHPKPEPLLSEEDALALAGRTDTAALVAQAGALRDQGFGDLITYSRKIFIPLTQLCRDVCHYCTFARTPRRIEQAFMPVEEVLELAQQGREQGCQNPSSASGSRSRPMPARRWRNSAMPVLWNMLPP